MAITKEQKERLVAEYVALLSSNQLTIWTENSGLRVSAITDLRSQLRRQGAEVHVAKNTLLKRALGQCGLPIPEEYLTGPTALIFPGEEIAATTKILTDFARTNRELRIKGGTSTGAILTSDEVSDLANLPSREVLLAQVLGGLQAPITGLVNVLAGTMRGLLHVLKARTEQLEGAGS